MKKAKATFCTFTLFCKTFINCSASITSMLICSILFYSILFYIAQLIEAMWIVEAQNIIDLNLTTNWQQNILLFILYLSIK